MNILISESQYKKILKENKKQILSEITLYHGTLRSNIPSITKYGLHGGVGDFIKDMYDDVYDDLDDMDEYVFSADKYTLQKSVNAIIHHIAKKLNKSFHNVTDQEFKTYGALIVIKDAKWDQRKDDDYEDLPIYVEPNDYYTTSSGFDYILTGQKLTNFLRKYGLFPIEEFNDTNKERKIKCLYNTVTNTIKRNQHEDLIKLKNRLEDKEFIKQINQKWFENVLAYFDNKNIIIDC